MNILESIFSNMRSEKMNAIIRSNVYWPILFLAVFIFPKYFPEWENPTGSLLWVAFACAMLLTLAYPYAWKIKENELKKKEINIDIILKTKEDQIKAEHQIHFKEKETEYKEKMEPLNNIRTDIKTLYDASKDFEWKEYQKETWEKIYNLIVVQDH